MGNGGSPVSKVKFLWGRVDTSSKIAIGIPATQILLFGLAFLVRSQGGPWGAFPLIVFGPLTTLLIIIVVNSAKGWAKDQLKDYKDE